MQFMILNSIRTHTKHINVEFVINRQSQHKWIIDKYYKTKVKNIYFQQSLL